MISDFSHVRQIARRQLILLTLLSCVFFTTLSLIHTPFAVPGQQKEFLINQGRSLAWITPGQEGWRTVTGAPVRSPIHQIVHSQEDAPMYYVAAESGLYARTAGDGIWTQLYNEEVFTVAEAGSTLLIGARRGLLRSVNQGQTWDATGQGLPAEAIPLIIGVAPSDRNVVYLGTAQHGLFHSRDGGQHFEPINQGLPRSIGAAPVTPVMHLVIDPADADTAYVSSEVNGVYKTTDGGQSWKAVNEGWPGLFQYRTYQPFLALHPAQRHTLYAVVGYPVHSHLIDNKIYKTTDGGGHWFAIHQLPDNTVFHSLTILPGDPVELALGFDGGVIRVKDVGQPVDGGPYWRPSPPPLRSGPALTSDVGDIAVIEDDGTLIQNFDLPNRSIEFTPTEVPGYVLSERPPALETEIGAQVPLSVNGSLAVVIPFPFQFYGTVFNSVFINSNGNLTFGRGNSDPRQSPTRSFAQFRQGPPKIAALWENYDPTLQGGVFVKTATDPNRLVVTWNNVRRTGSLGPDSSTFQIVLLADSRIRINYGHVTNPGGLVGLSPGSSQVDPLLINFSRDLPQTVDNRAVLEFFTGRGLDIQATARKFYATHADLYDQLVVFGSEAFQTNLTGSSPIFAFHVLVQNEVRGIGRPVGSFSGGPAAYGSAGRLQSFLNMNRLSLYPDDSNEEIRILPTFTPLDAIGHETAHRWLSYLLFNSNGMSSTALLQSDLSHWSFFLNSDASLMYGNRWLDREDGTFTSVEVTARYSALDEYAMGLRPPVDVHPFFFIAQPVDPAGRTRNNLPELDVTVSGSRSDVTIDQIISVNGPRLPAFGSSPTSLRQAYVLVVPEGQLATVAELEKLERFRREFEPYFNQITGQRAVVDTRLSPGQPDLIVEAGEVSPPMLVVGETAMVRFTIRNRGTAAAGLVLNEIRFSADEDVDTSDLLLKRVTTVSLAPGQSIAMRDIPIIVPQTVPSGTRFITVTIDAGNAARESNENNNQMVIPVTLVGSGITLTPFNESEPNNQMNQATPITPDAIITAELNPARDVDFYSFMARAGQALTVDINARSLTPPSPADTVVTLFDSGGIQLAENDDFAGSPDSFLQFIIPRAGPYFIRVRNASTQGGPGFTYQAIVTLRSTGSATEVEPNDSLSVANPITPDVVVSGVLNPTGDQDFYVLTARAGQLLSVDADAQSLIDPSAADTVLSVFDSTGGVIAENDDFGGSTDSFLQVMIPRSGLYSIRVRDVAGRGGPAFTYRLTVRLISVQSLQKR